MPRMIGISLALLLIAIPTTADAQARVPAEGTVAVGADAGFFFPDSDFETSPTVAGFGEVYLTPRVSFRGTLGWADPDFDRPGNASLRQVRLIGNILYNWEGGKWHPFVTFGAGAYFLKRHRDEREDGPSRTEAGFNAGGGIEYFTARTISIKGEAAYHAVAHDQDEPDASGLALTIGLKAYF